MYDRIHVRFGPREGTPGGDDGRRERERGDWPRRPGGEPPATRIDETVQADIAVSLEAEDGGNVLGEVCGEERCLCSR